MDTYRFPREMNPMFQHKIDVEHGGGNHYIIQQNPSQTPCTSPEEFRDSGTPVTHISRPQKSNSSNSAKCRSDHHCNSHRSLSPSYQKRPSSADPRFHRIVQDGSLCAPKEDNSNTSLSNKFGENRKRAKSESKKCKRTYSPSASTAIQRDTRGESVERSSKATSTEGMQFTQRQVELFDVPNNMLNSAASFPEIEKERSRQQENTHINNRYAHHSRQCGQHFRKQQNIVENIDVNNLDCNRVRQEKNTGYIEEKQGLKNPGGDQNFDAIKTNKIHCSKEASEDCNFCYVKKGHAKCEDDSQELRQKEQKVDKSYREFNIGQKEKKYYEELSIIRDKHKVEKSSIDLNDRRNPEQTRCEERSSHYLPRIPSGKLSRPTITKNLRSLLEVSGEENKIRNKLAYTNKDFDIHSAGRKASQHHKRMKDIYYIPLKRSTGENSSYKSRKKSKLKIVSKGEVTDTPMNATKAVRRGKHPLKNRTESSAVSQLYVVLITVLLIVFSLIICTMLLDITPAVYHWIFDPEEDGSFLSLFQNSL